MYFHWSKMEDIINVGGGNLMVQIYNATEDEKLCNSDVHVYIDGCHSMQKAGAILRLKPGESITLLQHVYHKFWGDEGHGPVILREVSMVNDNHNDNRFYESIGRFPAIEEDEKPIYLLKVMNILKLRNGGRLRSVICH